MKEVQDQPGQNKEGNRIVLRNRMILGNQTVLGHGMIYSSYSNADKVWPTLERRVTFVATDLATSNTNIFNWRMTRGDCCHCTITVRL